MRQCSSKPSVVQKCQSEQTQSLWACTGLRSVNCDRLAVFCLSGVSQRRDIRDRNSKRPIAKDGGNKGDKNAVKDVNETNANDKASDSASSQKNSGTNERDSSDKDRSQERSNSNSDGIDTQNVQGNHSGNGKDDLGDDSQGTIADDAKGAKLITLIEKVEKSINTPEDDLDERIRSWNPSLWQGVEFISSAQWHFDSLVDSKENDPIRRVIHKLGLHRKLEEKINQGAINGCQHKTYTRKYKDDVMKLSPSSRTPDSKRRQSKRHLFDRYLRQGAVFHRLCSLCPGLMGLIAPTLTIPEYVLFLIEVSVLIFQQDTNHRTQLRRIF